MGKVPALRHGDALITEQVAIFLYLADLFPDAGLAPQIGDPLRGPYLRWMVFYAACFEPAVIDCATARDPAPLPMSPYGDYDTMLRTVTDQLAKGPYLLGERFTAADVLWGGALTWTTMFKLVPELPVIKITSAGAGAAGGRQGQGEGCGARRSARGGAIVRRKILGWPQSPSASRTATPRIRPSRACRIAATRSQGMEIGTSNARGRPSTCPTCSMLRTTSTWSAGSARCSRRALPP